MKSTITIGSIEGPIAANEEIVLPVTISEWSNAYKKIEIVVDYDSSLLELDAIMISKNNFNGASFDYRKNKFTIEASPLSENQAQKVDGGEFCTIHFFANTYFEDATNVTLTAKIVGYSYGSEDKWKNTQQATVEVVAGGVIAGVPTECTHTGETEIRDAKEPTCGKKGSGGDTYCLDCGVKLAIDPIPATGNHIGGSASCCIQAVCDVCYQSYGELNNNLHIGGTELINKSETYTGDTYCMGCNTQLSKGEVIECTHEGGEATCCSKAVCEKCNAEYGEFDANNHAGETEIRDKSETYTGDTYCLGCGEMLTQGEEIKPAGILGDANGDGKINAMDAMIVSQYYVELPVSINVDVADVNGDGKINAMDAMLISQFYVELIPEFPAKQ